MINYFDKILYLYPDIQGVSFWHSKFDGTPWDHPYDGIVWENKDIRKPTKEELDALNDSEIERILNERKEDKRKEERNQREKKDLALIATFLEHKKTNPDVKFKDYLDYLESESTKID